jgi:hypothetical protein
MTGPLVALNTTQNSTQKAFVDNLRTDLINSKLGSYSSDIQVNRPSCVEATPTMGVCKDNMIQVYVAIYLKCSNVAGLEQAITTGPPLSLPTPHTISTYGLQALFITPSPDNPQNKQQNCGSMWFGSFTLNDLIGLVIGLVVAVGFLIYGVVRFVRRRRQKAAEAAGQPPITGSPAAPGGADGTPAYPYTPGQDYGLQVGTVTAVVTPGGASQAPKVDNYPYQQPAASPVPGYPQYGMPPAAGPYPNMYASTAPAYPVAPEQDPYTAAAAAMRAELAAGGGYPVTAQPPATTPPTDGPVSAGAVTYYKGWGN